MTNLPTQSSMAKIIVHNMVAAHRSVIRYGSTPPAPVKPVANRRVRRALGIR